MSHEQPTDSQNAGRIIAQLREQWDDEVETLVLEGKTGARSRRNVEQIIKDIEQDYEEQIDVYRQILHNAEHGKVGKHG